MSLVMNMHQRRTVASGRQNKDPNTAVAPEREKAPKQARPKLERSIQEVLNHTRNTTGRGRQMVLAELQKKQAAEDTSPAPSKASQPGRNSAKGKGRKSPEGARPAVDSVERKGKKRSISDTRKGALDQEETRVPLSALNNSTPNSDWTSDWSAGSPAGPSPNEGTRVYKKRQKTGATPPTPPLKSSSNRRQLMKAAPPPGPPVFQSNSPYVRTRRGGSRATSSPPRPVFESSSPYVRSRRHDVKATPSAPPPSSPEYEFNSAHVRNEKLGSRKPSKRIAEHGAEKDSSQPVRRQLISPRKRESDSNGFSSARENAEEGKFLASLRELDTQILEVERLPDSSFLRTKPEPQNPAAEPEPGFSSSPKSPEPQLLDTETLPELSLTPKSPETQLPEAEAQPGISFIPKGARGLHGIRNLGNTCYISVIVQILCNLPSFANGMEQFFGSIASQNVLEGSESFPDIESVHAALLKVFRDLKRAEGYETVDPTSLKHAFAKHQSSFHGCIQQDAHEFFCSLIDQVQEGVSSALQKQYSTEANRPKLEIVCPTTQNFSCSVRNNFSCAGCGNVSSVEETYRDFSLALPEDERADDSKDCSLESLLNHYFEETTMSRKCEKCGVEDTKAKAQILKLPHVLVLQLKRLHMDRDIPCTKVSAPVKFSSRLDIGRWCVQDKEKFWSPTTDNVQISDRMESTTSTCATESELRCNSEENTACGLTSSFESESQELPLNRNASSSSADLSTCYRLHGVVNHLGHSAFGGHFLSYILDPEADRWLRCDDSLVIDVSEESVFANVREGYMFFYVHEGVGSNASD